MNKWDINDTDADAGNMEEALATVEDGIAVLEEGYSEEKQIEQIISKMFQMSQNTTPNNHALDQSFEGSSTHKEDESAE